MRNTIILLSGFLLLLCFRTSAQITYQDKIGTSSRDIAGQVVALSDSGVIMLLYSDQFGNVLIRLDASGNIIWKKRYWTAANFYFSLYQMPGNTLLLAGTNNVNTLLPHLALFKIDENGNVVWNRSYGFSHGAEIGTPHQTLDNGYIIPFQYDTMTNPQSSRCFGLLKTDSLGNINWCKKIQADSVFMIGMTVSQMADSGYIFIGTTLDNMGISYRDFSLKLDQSGNIIHLNYFEYLVLNDIIQINPNRYIMCGESMYCFDSTAHLVWQKALGDNYNSIYISSAVLRDANKIILTGYIVDTTYSSDIVFIEVDTAGTILNCRKYGDTLDDFSGGICRTADGGYCQTGYTENFGADSMDIYVIKTDSTGRSGCNETIENYPVDSTWNILIHSIPISDGTINPFPTNDTLFSDTVSVTQNVLCFTPLSIEGLQAADDVINIYPNPAHDNFTIYVADHSPESYLYIFNMYGEIEQSISLHETDQHINCCLKPGIYILMYTKGEERQVKKLVVQ
jgi:hypothetical protein